MSVLTAPDRSSPDRRAPRSPLDVVLHPWGVSEGKGIAAHAPRAMLAAGRLADGLGLDASGLNVLHSSNNTITHLPRCGLVAKVGTSPEAPETLARELAIALHLLTEDAEIAPPATCVSPGPYRQDGLVITLWEFVEHDPDAELDDDHLADSLERLHAHLATWSGDATGLPRADPANRATPDDQAMRAMPPDGLELVRARFAEVARPLLERAEPTHVLHGGPHSHNVLSTPSGLLGSTSKRAAAARSRQTSPTSARPAPADRESTSNSSPWPGRCSASASPPSAGRIRIATPESARRPNTTSPRSHTKNPDARLKRGRLLLGARRVSRVA